VTKISDRTPTASQRSIKITALVVLALLALALTGCRADSIGTDPVPVPAPSNQYAPLGDPSGNADEYGEYGDEPGTYGEEPGYPYDPGYPDEPGYPDDPGSYSTDEPGGGVNTNPCAFPGDPLCSDTPITIPPPQLNPPF
jgi:hypothetical protein